MAPRESNKWRTHFSKTADTTILAAQGLIDIPEFVRFASLFGFDIPTAPDRPSNP